VLSTSSAATTTEVEEDVDRGPLGVLLVGPAVATTEVKEDIDGRLLGGAVSRSNSGHQRS
jgi:hypothetical protein